MPKTDGGNCDRISHLRTPRSAVKRLSPNQPNLISAIETWLEEI
ncbi:hypothetical protein AP9108_26735 [Arthrospira sp. PCC 9108]|nr:hypothetical protein AP9108_26735 [Arthrospira sp. PCC 9108]